MLSASSLSVTPWADWHEWASLKREFERGNLIEANRRLSIYLVRRKRSVPIQMVTSISLAYQLAYPSATEYAQRATLSMLIVRFVNAMTDMMQTRMEGGRAKSVAILASVLDMPLLLVEIRHHATHAFLPRLQTLVSAASQALMWIQIHYWDEQYRAIEPLLRDEMEGVRRIFEHSEHLNAPSEFQDDSDIETDDISSGAELVRELNALSKQIDDKLDTTRKRKRQTSESLWQVCDNTEGWSKTPLGLTPYQTKPVAWSCRDSLEDTADEDCEDSKDTRNESIPEEHGTIFAGEAKMSETPTGSCKTLSTEEETIVQDTMKHYYSLISS